MIYIPFVKKHIQVMFQVKNVESFIGSNIERASVPDFGLVAAGK
jgi:hypothetical protein